MRLTYTANFDIVRSQKTNETLNFRDNFDEVLPFNNYNSCLYRHRCDDKRLWLSSSQSQKAT